jgi:hypothetical protein
MKIHTVFCRNKDCPNHREENQPPHWFSRRGYYKTKAFGRVQKYQCNTCGSYFSDQTYSLNYYLKRKTDFKSLAHHCNSNNSNGFIGRQLQLSTDSIRLRRDRLGRNALFVHCSLLESLSLNEPLVADGLESYTASKYFPNNLNVLVGKESQFIYGFTLSYFRRKGVMSKKQKKRAQKEYADKSFASSRLAPNFMQLLQFAAGKAPSNQIVLHTDEHKTYQAQVKLFNQASRRINLIHHQTNSKHHRDTKNPLFAVNYLDRLLRKDCSMYRRETICFSRSSYNELLRMAFYLYSHNYCKPKRIGTQAKQIEDRHYSETQIPEHQVQEYKNLIYEARFLVSKIKKIPRFFKKIWLKKMGTPLQNLNNWVPKFAYE